MRRLIPNITFIKGNMMAFQKRPIFVLEGNPIVMRFLIGHVLGNLLECRFSDRECRVVILIVNAIEFRIPLPPLQGDRRGGLPRLKPG